MPTFYYRAKKGTETVTGQVDAPNQEEAVELIHQLGLLPVTVDTSLVKSPWKEPSSIGKIKSKELYSFSRQLSNMLKAGIPILHGLEILKNQTHSGPLKAVIAQIILGIKEGQTFSSCLQNFPRIFSPLYVAMVSAGEESGNLKEILSHLFAYQQQQEEIRSKIRMALIYPLFMMVVGVGTIIFMLTFVMPRMANLFLDLKESLPMPTKILMNFSNFLKETGVILIPIAIVLGVIFQRWRNSHQGRVAISLMQLKLFFLKDLAIKVELARFCRALSMLLGGGIPLVKAIRMAAATVTNDIMRKELLTSLQGLEEGSSFGHSLNRLTWIPAVLVSLVIVAEESGSLALTLEDIAQIYDQETSEILKTLMSLLEPLMILLVGGAIGFIVLAMLLPIFDINFLAR